MRKTGVLERTRVRGEKEGELMDERWKLREMMERCRKTREKRHSNINQRRIEAKPARSVITMRMMRRSLEGEWGNSSRDRREELGWGRGSGEGRGSKRERQEEKERLNG